MVTEHKTYWDEEKKKLKRHWFRKNKKDHGLSRSWYSDGQLMNEYNLKESNFEGLQRVYSNGHLIKEWTRKDGDLHGTHKEWSEDGLLKFKKYAFKGKKCTKKEFRQNSANEWAEDKIW